jgi:hypothetical protein
MFTEVEITSYEEECSTTDVEESGIWEGGDWDGLNSLCDLGMGLMG